MVKLSITSRAAAKIQELAKEEGNEKLGLRIFITGGGCGGYRYGMALDENVYEDDEVVEQNGAKVIVDKFSARFIEGSEIDYLETLMGAGFVVKNPNVVSTCGCGHSFNIAPPQEESVQ